MKQQFSRRSFLRTGTQALGAASLSPVLIPPASAQTDEPGELSREDLGYAWVVKGAGGNVLTIPGMNENGALMVDGGLAAHSDALLNEVFDITGQDRIHTLINTHWHPEQTGSNERVGAEGGTIFAHENTQWTLQNAVMSSMYEGRYGPLADAGIPNQTFRETGELSFAGQRIIYGYLPAAHTNGDLFLYLPILDTLIAGGPVTTDRWPVLDIQQGGFAGGLLRAYETLADVISADTIVVPAHGPIVNGTWIMRMRSIMTAFYLDVSEQYNLGMGPDDMVAMKPLAEYEELYGNSDLFVDHFHRSIQMASTPD